MREHLVSDLFYDRYSDLPAKKLAELGPLRRVWIQLHESLIGKSDDEKELTKYGIASIAVLRVLRKAPFLVDKITVDQALDCLNELTFFRQPWHDFPPIHDKFSHPDEFMHNRTFDHFIYADHEFSQITMHAEPTTQSLAKLAACLYNVPGQIHFNEDAFPERAKIIERECKEWQLQLVMHTYANVREWIVERCKTLLPAGSSETVHKPSATGPMWKELKQRTAELKLTWKDPASQETGYVGHGRYLEILDHLESISRRKNAA